MKGSLREDQRDTQAVPCHHHLQVLRLQPATVLEASVQDLAEAAG